MNTSQGKELKAPEEKTVFEEDLSPEEKAKILKEKMLDTHHDRADTFDIAYVHLCTAIVFFQWVRSRETWWLQKTMT